MVKHSEEVTKGELWEAFKKTVYFEELEEFMFKQIKEMRDNIIQFSMGGRHEEARDLSQKLSGFLMVSEFIDDTISTRVESLEYEREQKDFEKQLPHRL